MSLTGKWEGKLLDVTGPRASLRLDLKHSQGKLSGDFSVAFLSPESSGCCGGKAARLSQSGPLVGKVDANGRVHLDYQVTIGLEPVQVTLEGSVVGADPHARKALIGSYSVGKGAGDLTLEGGVCVLWLYTTEDSRGLKDG